MQNLHTNRTINMEHQTKDGRLLFTIYFPPSSAVAQRVPWDERRKVVLDQIT
jgi:hypothetical protein